MTLRRIRNSIGPDNLAHWLFKFKRIGRFVSKRKLLSFGLESEVRYGSYLVGCKQIKIGNRVTIRPGTFIHAESESIDISVEIQDYVLIGCGVHIYVENHRYNDISTFIYHQGHEIAKKVTLEMGCWLGAGSIILPGVTVGKNSVVAAGSVVTKDVPPFSVVAGVPARVIRRIEN